MTNNDQQTTSKRPANDQDEGAVLEGRKNGLMANQLKGVFRDAIADHERGGTQCDPSTLELFNGIVADMEAILESLFRAECHSTGTAQSTNYAFVYTFEAAVGRYYVEGSRALEQVLIVLKDHKNGLTANQLKGVFQDAITDHTWDPSTLELFNGIVANMEAILEILFRAECRSIAAPVSKRQRLSY